VTANVAPKLCAEIHAAWRAGRIEHAIALQDQLLPLHDAMFCEPSPGPVKFAASLLGFCTPFLRLPLAHISTMAQDKVRAAMTEVGLI
jgi:4-hydroxy-tetrahydrodipicolinate synthase